MQPTRKPRLSLIAAVAANGVIGSENALPWRLPEDLKRFKTTLGHPIMGRKTYESIGRPLPGRRNIIITHNATYAADGCGLQVLSVTRWPPATERPRVFVIGGAQIYAEALPLAQRLYLASRDFPGDARFRSSTVTLGSKRREPQSTSEGLAFAFVV